MCIPTAVPSIVWKSTDALRSRCPVRIWTCKSTYVAFSCTTTVVLPKPTVIAVDKMTIVLVHSEGNHTACQEVLSMAGQVEMQML